MGLPCQPVHTGWAPCLLQGRHPLLCFWAGTVSVDQVSVRTASGLVSKVCKDTVAD